MTRIKCDKTIRVKALSANQRALRFPDSRGLLAELNLPDDVIATVIGKKVTVSVFPEEKAMTRKIDDPTHEDSPFLIDREGICWNGHRPVRVQFADGQGRVWRCPRYWLDGVPELSECAAVEADEEINLPTEWDLGDVNVSPVAQGRPGEAGTTTTYIVRFPWKVVALCGSKKKEGPAATVQVGQQWTLRGALR